MTHDDKAENIWVPQGIYEDARGAIISLPDFTTVGTMVISSRPGAVRGNHRHANESHLMYVASGRMIYVEEDDDGELVSFEVNAREAVVSPRNHAHCTVFPQDSVIVVLSDADRTGLRYEDEIVRVPPMQERVDLRRFGIDLTQYATDLAGQRVG